MRDLLRYLRGPVHVIWNRGDAHKGDAIRRLERDFPRPTGHFLPPYAPELNPVEHVWNHVKYGVGESAADEPGGTEPVCRRCALPGRPRPDEKAIVLRGGQARSRRPEVSRLRVNTWR